MTPQPPPNYAPLASVLRQPLPIPSQGHAPTTLDYVPGMCLLLDDGPAIHAFSEALLPMWTIQGRSKLYGWVLSGDLYVQDGAVLAQYDLRGLLHLSPDQAPVPVNAVNMESGDHWSIQDSGSTAFKDWFSVDAKWQHSPPAVWSGAKDRVFSLSEKGLLHSLPGDLVEDQRSEAVRLAWRRPDLPPRLCVADGDSLILQYLSSAQDPHTAPDAAAAPKVVLLDRPSVGVSIEFRRMYTPGAGNAHWLAMTAAAGASGSYARRISWQPEGAVDPIFYSESAGSPAWQIFAMTNQVVVRMGGSCAMAQLDAGRFWTAAPVVVVNSDGLLLYGVTSDGKGDVRLEQFKVPAGTGSGWFPGAWPTVASQLGAIGTWLHEGSPEGAVPFDPDSALICYAAAARVMGFSRATYIERLPAAAGRAATGMVNIATRAGVRDVVGAAIGDVSAASALMDAVAGWSYGVRELAQRLKKAGSPGRDVAANLMTRGFDLAAVMSAMHDAGFSTADILMGIWPGSMAAKWWAGRCMVGPAITDNFWTNYYAPSPEAVYVAHKLGATGYTAEEIPVSCLGLGPRPETATYAAVSIFRIIFAGFTPEQIETRMVAAGHDHRNVRWCLKFIHNYPCDGRRFLLNQDYPMWATEEPFFPLVGG